MNSAVFAGSPIPCSDSSPRPYEATHRTIACHAAEEGIVLLKNENQTLPLTPGCSIALYGTGALYTLKGGTGSGDVNARETVSIRDGLYAAGFRIANEPWLQHCEIVYEQARQQWKDRVWQKLKTGQAAHFFEAYATTPFSSPEYLPSKYPCDTSIYVVSRSAGEGADRTAGPGDYEFSESEKRDLRLLCNFYPSVILILNCGGTMDLSILDELSQIKAVILLSQPGMEGGDALANVLCGNVSPSGRLTDSWPMQLTDHPGIQMNSADPRSVLYSEGIFVGYRYFDSFDIPVRFGFGFGLSYTQFCIEAGTLNFESGPNPHFALHCTVKNIGKHYCSKEVVQLYATCPCGSMAKEYRRLISFAKTDLLAPGKEQTLLLEFTPDMLATFDASAGGWVLDRGIFTFWLGDSLQNSRPVGGICLNEQTLLQAARSLWPDSQLKELSPGLDRCIERRRLLEIRVAQQGLPIHTLHPNQLIKTAKSSFKSDTIAERATEIAKQLDDASLVRTCVGKWHKEGESQLGSAGLRVPGSAGETNNIKNIPSMVLADGPAGLRLVNCYFKQDGKTLTPPLEQCFESGFLAREKYNPGGVPHYQYCTAFPVGTMLAQSWNSDLLYEIGTAVGYEMSLFGISLWLAPGMNIHRNPLCGRNFEYFSEDPLLSGRMAAAITSGVQSCPGCGVTIKHFACNNQETERLESNSIVSERALREIYLRGFQIAVEQSHPEAIMTSYNLVNGIHSANNFALCTQIARNEWNFDGIFMTDWGTTFSSRCTPSGCIQAGNDLIMPGSQQEYDALIADLLSGSLDRKELQTCAFRIICTALHLYESQNPSF